MDEPTTIRLPALAGGQAESWRALIEIAPRLGRHWLLIGGQMVFLHEVERQSTKVHPTNDIDLVVDLRVEPTALDHTHAVLADAGFEQDQPSPEGVAHRYRRGEATIDVLAPDHIGARAKLSLGSGRTIEAPGTTQAFGRVSLVRVELTTAPPRLCAGQPWSAHCQVKPRPWQRSCRSHRRNAPSTFATSTHSLVCSAPPTEPAPR